MVRVVSHFGLTIALTATIGLVAALLVLRLRPRRGPTMLLLGALLVAGWVARDLLSGGAWLATDARFAAAVAANASPAVALLAAWVAAPLSLVVAPAVFGVAALRAFVRDDVVAGYRHLIAGPLLGGTVWMVHVSYLRAAPASDGLVANVLSTSPNEQAAFAVVLAVAAWPTRYRAMAIMLGTAATLAALAAGQAWLSDVVLGVAAGTAFAATAHWVQPGALAAASLPAWIRRHFIDGARGWWTITAIGVAARIVTLWTYPLGTDVAAYSVMGWQVATGHGLTMPWGGVYAFDGVAATSQHFPPAYPWLLAATYAVTGYSAAITHAVAIALGLLAIGVTWWTTRDLYGPRAGAIAAALIAANPLLVWTTGEAMPESLVVALFAATLWAILKSLDAPAYIVPGGLLAGLGYLSKSSIGYFFIVAGLGGLAWRLRFRGLAVLRDKYYLGAIAAFGAIVGAWSLRNWRAHGTWETSSHLSAAYGVAAGNPLDWLLRTEATFLIMLTAAYLVMAGLLPWLPALRGAPRLSDEHASGLWLAAFLPLALTSAIDAALWSSENFKSLGNVRYLTFVAVPIAWLLLRHAPRATPRQRAGTQVAATITVCLLLAGTLVVSFNPLVAPDVHAPGRHLASSIPDGATVDFLAVPVPYAYYFGLTHDGSRDITVTVPRGDTDTATSDYLITPRDASSSHDAVASYDGVTLWRLRS